MHELLIIVLVEFLWRGFLCWRNRTAGVMFSGIFSSLSIYGWDKNELARNKNSGK